MQTVALGAATSGKGFTVTCAVAVSEHPLFVTITEYVVLDVGEIVIDELEFPFVQEYVPPPVAEIVADCPVQMVGFGPAVAVIPVDGAIETVCMVVHPPASVTVTV